MKAAWIAFTQKGTETGQKLQSAVKKADDQWSAWAKGTFPVKEPVKKVQVSLGQWTENMFGKQDAIVFIGAAGIAVRAIAPYLRSKMEDPAVLVIDEMGKYVIPLVSGHIGGANKFARKAAEALGAVPVITTATDLNERFAVDQWAAENHLLIDNMQSAKQVSVQLLQEKEIGFSCDEPIEIRGSLPKGLVEEKQEMNIHLSYREFGREHPGELQLIPKIAVLGIGCRRGTPAEKIRSLVLQVLERENIDLRAVESAATIDLKQDESGLLEFCGEMNLDLNIYSKEELKEVEGEFSSSEFVSKVTGVDNVCERAAMAAAGAGSRLMIKKQAKDGVTLAVALKKAVYTF